MFLFIHRDDVIKNFNKRLSYSIVPIRLQKQETVTILRKRGN